LLIVLEQMVCEYPSKKTGRRTKLPKFVGAREMSFNLVFRSAVCRRFLFALVALIFACPHAYSDDTPAVAAWKAALVEQLRSHAG
jgi:hypothetical protein